MSLDPDTWLQALAALAAVLLLIWGAARLLRLTPLAAPGGALSIAPGKGRPRRLSIEEAIALDSRRRVLLLRCDGRDLLLLTGGGAAGGEDRVLGWLPPPPPPSVQAAGDRA